MTDNGTVSAADKASSRNTINSERSKAGIDEGSMEVDVEISPQKVQERLRSAGSTRSRHSAINNASSLPVETLATDKKKEGEQEKPGETLNKDLKDYMKSPPHRGLTATPEFLRAAAK